MFCLLAMFTCLVGCSTGSKASFPETFIGSVGQGKTDALKTLGTTEQALSDYTVDVYGKTADVQLSFDAYRGDETSAGKLNYAELTVPCTIRFLRRCKKMQAAKMSAPYNTSGAVSVKTSRCFTFITIRTKTARRA